MDEELSHNFLEAERRTNGLEAGLVRPGKLDRKHPREENKDAGNARIPTTAAETAPTSKTVLPEAASTLGKVIGEQLRPLEQETGEGGEPQAEIEGMGRRRKKKGELEEGLLVVALLPQELPHALP